MKPQKHVRFEFFIPINPYAPYRDFRDRLIRIAGGATENISVGHWVAPDTKVCTETVAHLMCVVPDTEMIRANIEAIATTYGIEAEQHEVLIIEDGNIPHTINTGA